MRIENDNITDFIIMFCMFKGLCCIIVNLIVKLLPLERFSSNDDDDIIDSGKNNANVNITNHLLFIHETGILDMY